MGTFGSDYVIITDASVDIDLDIAMAGGLKIIPMSFSIGDQMKTFSGVLSQSDYMDFYYGQRQGDFTKTSKITAEDFEKYFRAFAKKGQSVLYISLSSGLSESYDAALTARKTVVIEYPDIEIKVVDSLSATGGMGIYVERAIRNRAEGMTIDENYKYLNMMHNHVHIWFFVQDLGYLKRGGRISAAKSLVGSMLNIKPVLMVNEKGELVSYKNARGIDNAKNIIFELFKEHYENVDDPIYIIDADATSDADDINELINRFNPCGEIRRRTLTPIIGAHTGPGIVAVCHLGKKYHSKEQSKNKK